MSDMGDDSFYQDAINDSFFAREDFKRIWQICHTPSSQHPKGGHAYTHFMSDFDEIRAICRKWVAK